MSDQSDHQRAAEIFLAARKCQPHELDALLDRECDGNAQLRGRVLHMLEHDHDNITPLDEAMLGAVTRDGVFAGAARTPDPDMKGRRIGPYTIVREIGRGGMGVVYLATDTRLDREVAIKALPEHLSSDADRLARFQREARVLASLNHPNIGAIYGIEEVNNQQFLVLEYIDGITLDARLSRGALPLDDALGIAVQIAEALESAHEKGVIHRDLKPGNIMLTPSGGVKVLDFGLARTSDASPSSLGQSPAWVDSPTVTSPMPVHSPTIPGAILGTAGYMSPEQARGRPVDKRSDIFSFGCVLYEMLTGAQPFPGESVADSIGATLHKDPEWNLLPPGTPPTIRMLLARCLAKDRHKRVHDIADARIELEHAIDDPTLSVFGLAGESRVGAARRRFPFAAIAALLILVAAGAVAFMRLAGAPPVATLDNAVRFTISSKGAGYTAVARNGWVSESAISPDGRHIVFTAIGADNTRRLWVRPLNSIEARVLHDTANAEWAFWCEDSRSIGFFENGRLWRIGVDGGARRLITNVADYEWGATWNRNGVILIGQMGSGLMQVDANGGTPQYISTLSQEHFEGGHIRPHFLPDGEQFIFHAMTFDPDKEAPLRRVYAGRLGTEQITLIAEMTVSQVWYANPNLLMYVDDGKVMAAPFDARSMRFTEPATTVAEGCMYFGATGLSRLSVSRDGTIVFGEPVTDNELVWTDETGARLGTVAGPGIYEAIRISPNGDSVAVAVLDARTYMGEIWLYGLTRTTRTRLHARGWWHGWPAWSPNSSTVYFAWARPAAPDIFSARADGVGGIEPVYRTNSAVFPSDVSRDGKWLILMGDLQTRVVPLHGDSEGDFAPIQGWLARVSPDGELIAYISDVTGRSQVYVERFMGGTGRVQISVDGGTHPVWAADGSRLFFQQPSIDRPWGGTKMMAVDVSDPNWLDHPQPHLLFESADLFDKFDVAPEGERFLLKTVPAEMPPMHVIANWPRQWAKNRR